jgi:hypothetical protein
VVASYSSLQGLLVWPAGIFLLYHRRRRWAMVGVWIAAAGLTMAGYFHNYDSHVATSPHGEAISHPVASLEYFGSGVGDVLGIPFHYHQGFDPWLVTLGLTIVAVAVWVIARYGIRRDDRSSGPFAVALIVIGLLFVAVITEGRIVFGAWSAGASRYTTFELLVPTGIYLALLGRPSVPRERTGASGGGRAVVVERWLGSGDRWAVSVARGFIALLIVAQVAVSLPNAVPGARNNYEYQTKAAQVTLDIRHLPNRVVVYYLYLFSNARFVRQQVNILEHHHLSLFAGSHESLRGPPGPRPTNGSTDRAGQKQVPTSNDG